MKIILGTTVASANFWAAFQGDFNLLSWLCVGMGVSAFMIVANEIFNN